MTSVTYSVHPSHQTDIPLMAPLRGGPRWPRSRSPQLWRQGKLCHHPSIAPVAIQLPDAHVKQVGKISAAMYTIIGSSLPSWPKEVRAESTVAMVVMLYALVVYQMRARSIRLRTGAPYDDRLGPVSVPSCLPRLQC